MRILFIFLFAVGLGAVGFAQPVQFEINPAFGITGGRVATGLPRNVSNGNGEDLGIPSPGAVSITTALNFKVGNAHFFPSWAFRIGIYSLTVSNPTPAPWGNNNMPLTFLNLGMPVYLNYIYKVNKTLGLRASAGVEALVETGGGTSSFAAEGVGGIILVDKVSIGVKYYQMLGNYYGDMRSRSQYNVHAWMLDFKIRKGGW